MAYAGFAAFNIKHAKAYKLYFIAGFQSLCDRLKNRMTAFSVSFLDNPAFAAAALISSALFTEILLLVNSSFFLFSYHAVYLEEKDKSMPLQVLYRLLRLLQNSR